MSVCDTMTDYLHSAECWGVGADVKTSKQKHESQLPWAICLTAVYCSLLQLVAVACCWLLQAAAGSWLRRLVDVNCSWLLLTFVGYLRFVLFTGAC